ncbi:MAG: hypothetical protein ABII08_02785 [Candidatus Beckwithbacteria bacterium]
MSVFAILLFTAMLSGCALTGDDESKTVGQPETTTETSIVSDDDSLETIEEELDDTELEEFETELDALDEEIDQL